MISVIPKTIPPYKFVYYACCISGLMNNKGRPWSLIYTGYNWFNIISAIVTAILELCFGNGNVTDIVEAFSALVINIQIFSKLFNFFMRGEEILKFLDRLENIRTQMLEDQENRIYIEKAEEVTRKYITMLATLFLTCPFLSLFSSFVTDYMTNFENRELFFKIWIPWSMDDVGPYIVAKIFAALMALTGCMTYTTFGILEFTFTFQMSAYLKILQNYLETKGPKDKMVYRQHQILTETIDIYNRLFSGQTYLETVASSLMPCGFSLNLIRGIKKHDMNQFDTVQKIIVLLSAPCIVCYCGQEISTEVENLHEASYMSNWYEESPKIRRDLFLMMLKTMKPTKLNFKMFVTFNFECLAKVMQGLYSYIMMIINFDI